MSTKKPAKINGVDSSTFLFNLKELKDDLQDFKDEFYRFNKRMSKIMMFVNGRVEVLYPGEIKPMPKKKAVKK